jgi:hypothetical protein
MANAQILDEELISFDRWALRAILRVLWVQLEDASGVVERRRNGAQ